MLAGFVLVALVAPLSAGQVGGVPASGECAPSGTAVQGDPVELGVQRAQELANVLAAGSVFDTETDRRLAEIGPCSDWSDLRVDTGEGIIVVVLSDSQLVGQYVDLSLGLVVYPGFESGNLYLQCVHWWFDSATNTIEAGSTEEIATFPGIVRPGPWTSELGQQCASPSDHPDPTRFDGADVNANVWLEIQPGENGETELVGTGLVCDYLPQQLYSCRQPTEEPYSQGGLGCESRDATFVECAMHWEESEGTELAVILGQRAICQADQCWLWMLGLPIDALSRPPDYTCAVGAPCVQAPEVPALAARLYGSI